MESLDAVRFGAACGMEREGAQRLSSWATARGRGWGAAYSRAGVLVLRHDDLDAHRQRVTAHAAK